MLCRRLYYAVGHHKAGLRPLCTDLYGPPAPQTAYHSNIASCSRSHCAPGAFLHFGALLPRCRGPPFSRFASPPNLEKRRTENVVSPISGRLFEDISLLKRAPGCVGSLEEKRPQDEIHGGGSEKRTAQEKCREWGRELCPQQRGFAGAARIFCEVPVCGRC